MSDIFVSYAHQDRDRIAPLVQRLESERWSVWWDRELIPGDRFEQAIDEAISRAKVVVVAWSRAALESDWVHNEALDGLSKPTVEELQAKIVELQSQLGEGDE